MRRFVLALLIFSGTQAICAAAEISQLQVQQAITSTPAGYSAAPGLKISFNLTAPARVTVQIKKHLAGYSQFKWPWLKEPYLIRTIAAGQLGAGPQSVTWDGLDDTGMALTETHNLAVSQLDVTKSLQPAQMTETVPVNYVQVVVKAGDEQLAVNFERAGTDIEPVRKAVPFRMGSLDNEGHYLTAAFVLWSAQRYTSDFIVEPDKVIPNGSFGGGALPAECTVVHQDSKGHVLLMDRAGVWRFGLDGRHLQWPFKADYTSADAGNNGVVLGGRTQDQTQATKPGFGTDITGFCIGDNDTIYISMVGPAPGIHVFDDDGKFLRKLPTPAGKGPNQIGWAGNNTLAVAFGDSWGLMDATTGAVKKMSSDVAANYLVTDRDGNIYAGNGPGNLFRYTPNGDPLPFNPSLPDVKGNHLELFVGDIQKTPSKSTIFPAGGIWGLAIARDGSLYFSQAYHQGAPGIEKTDLLHYARDGTFIPDSLQAKLGCHNLGNVYLDHEPATMDLITTNFTDQKQTFEVNWSLTDINGKRKTGTSTLFAAPNSREVSSFTVDASDFGHYGGIVRISQNGRVLDGFPVEMARVASRPIATDRYSPFAMVWVGDWEVMALAGVKSHRGDSANWGDQVEPAKGSYFPEHPQVPQYGQGGADSLRAFAHKNGFLLLNGLDYGEHWLGGDQSLYDYDAFYGFVLHVLDSFAGHGEAFYQFWNEPNFFWHVPGPFGSEQFALVQAHVWSIIKARDKDAISLGDGNAGNIDMMRQFSDFGAAGYTDTVEMHYPGATPITFNNMPMPDLPETKANAIATLTDLRDKLFPGKQVWNTEENIPDESKDPVLAAINLPRVEIPQFAVGVEKIYQFSQTGFATSNSLHDPTCFLDEFGQPFPTYAAYANMTKQIDGSVFVTKPDFGVAGTYGYLFANGTNFILVANDIAGSLDVSVDAGVPSVTVVDLMGNARQVATDGGKLKLTLSPSMQYVLIPRSSEGMKSLAAAELKKQLGALQAASATEIPAQMAEAVKTAATNREAMNRLYHLFKAAQLAEVAGQVSASGEASEARAARQAVETTEGADGYLRKGRLALDWSEHAAQLSRQDPTMAWPAFLAARAAEKLAQTDSLLYPGVAIGAYIGEPGEIARIRATVPVANRPETAIDPKFRYEINRKPGDAFEVELTVSDYYKHPISGTVTPRLPPGWQATPASASYAVEAGKLQRFMFNVTVPADAKPGTYGIGGQTIYNGATVPELYAMRIKL